MYHHTYTKRVRYAETDKMGYLYYGNYPMYYEIGRVELIRSLGITYKDFEDIHGIMLPVVSMEVRYKLPAYYDEELTIHSKLHSMPSKIIDFDFEIENEKNLIINTANVKLFFIDMRTNKRMSAPSFLTRKLQEYF